LTVRRLAGSSFFFLCSEKVIDLSNDLEKNDPLCINYRMTPKNIYGEDLRTCRDQREDEGGSWDGTGRCTELGGGVHQICALLPENFARDTFQTENWSASRAGKPHCLCLGAFALYSAHAASSGKHLELKCDAIPETALEPGYVQRWSTWNGFERENQAGDGLANLFRACADGATRRQLSGLKENFRRNRLQVPLVPTKKSR
jgi:hypothetical protein